MERIKLPLFLFAILIALIGITVFSIHPGKVNYHLQGRINVIGGSDVGVELLFMDKGAFSDLDSYKDVHRTFTEEGGTFGTNFPALANADVDIVVLKEDYLPVIYTHSTAEQGASTNQIVNETILVAGQLETILPSHDRDQNTMPCFVTYSKLAEEGHSQQIIQQDHIQYLVDLRPGNNRLYPQMLQATFVTENRTYRDLFFDPSASLVQVNQPPADGNGSPQLIRNRD